MVDGDEIIDLVSKEDEVIGSAKRKVVYSKKLNNFRTINGFLINHDGELWIPVRHRNKSLWPQLFDASVGGHVQSDESYDGTFIREADEELNLNVDKINYRTLGKLTPHNTKVGSFMKIYLIFYNKDPVYNLNDFEGGQWFEPQKLLELLSTQKLGKPDLQPILQWMIFNNHIH